MPSIVVLDANVLFSARLRDLWLQLSQSGVVRVLWTDAIEAEWTAAVVRSRPELAGLVTRTVATMRSPFPLSYIPDDPVTGSQAGFAGAKPISKRSSSGAVVEAQEQRHSMTAGSNADASPCWPPDEQPASPKGL